MPLLVDGGPSAPSRGVRTERPPQSRSRRPRATHASPRCLRSTPLPARPATPPCRGPGPTGRRTTGGPSPCSCAHCLRGGSTAPERHRRAAARGKDDMTDDAAVQLGHPGGQHRLPGEPGGRVVRPVHGIAIARVDGGEHPDASRRGLDHPEGGCEGRVARAPEQARARVSTSRHAGHFTLTHRGPIVLQDQLVD